MHYKIIEMLTVFAITNLWNIKMYIAIDRFFMLNNHLSFERIKHSLCNLKFNFRIVMLSAVKINDFQFFSYYFQLFLHERKKAALRHTYCQLTIKFQAVMSTLSKLLMKNLQNYYLDFGNAGNNHK